MSAAVDTAAEAFRAVRLSTDEAEGIWSHGGAGAGPTGWAVAAGERHGLPLARLFAPHVVDMGLERRPLGGDLAIEALATAIAADPAAGRALAREARERAAGLRRAREATLAAKVDALGALVVAILEQ